HRGGDERRLAQLRRWVFLVDRSKLLDRRWLSVEVTKSELNGGAIQRQNLSAAEQRIQVWRWVRFRRRRSDPICQIRKLDGG
ncbi:hypothetical protein U1Q18_026840, partial [Sarracenia purpurea var. burkii]